MLAAELHAARAPATICRGQIPRGNQNRPGSHQLQKRAGETGPFALKIGGKIYGLLTAGMESTSVAERPTVISMLLD